MSRFQNAVYLEDVSERIRLLQDVGQLSLAYLTAKSHGLTEKAETILAAAGKTEEDVELPENAEDGNIQPIIQTVSNPLQNPNWPLLTVSKSFFEGAFAAANSKDKNVTSAPTFAYDEGIDNIDEAGGDWGADDNDLGISSSNTNGIDDKQDLINGHISDNDDGESGGWDNDMDIRTEIDAEIRNVAVKESAGFVAPVAGVAESSLWVHTSQLAADHISSGSFETAMQVIRKKIIKVFNIFFFLLSFNFNA